MVRNLHEIKQKDVFSINPPPISPPPMIYEKDSNFSSVSSSLNRISPVILLVIIILSVVFFIIGLLHLLVRYLKKKSHFSPIYHSNRYPETARSHSLQRQLQQLFRQHDSGLDQAVIDALPVFCYKDIMGLKEPLDCAVCLYDFSCKDKLRLLPMCSHAFHIDCIDTWLLSNSTCPLCRSTLLSSGLLMQNPISSNTFHSDGNDNGPSNGPKKGNFTEENAVEKRVFSVRLGKYRSSNEGEASGQEESRRRCYSMDRDEYVMGDLNLQVALSHDITVTVREDNELSAVGGDLEDKKITSRTRGDSFSVSKIWLWSKKNKLPCSTIRDMDMSSSVNACKLIC